MNTSLVKTVFQQEWKQFCRQWWMPVSLAMFSIVALGTFWLGTHAVQVRRVQADTIRVNDYRKFEKVAQKLADTLTEQGKKEATTAGLAALINYRMQLTVAKSQQPLAAMSTGLMDIRAWHWTINYLPDYKEDPAPPVTNPLVLATGSFDYAFVLVYLLPLLVVLFCYRVYDGEKTAGTIPLLVVQYGSLARLLRLKLLFRFLLIGSAVIILNGIGFVWCGAIGSNLLSCGWWMAVSLLYLGFWFAVCDAIVALRRQGISTLLLLVSVWMALLLVVPSLVSSYVQARFPLPLKDDIDAYRRQESEAVWSTPPAILCDSFNRYNPQYAGSFQLSRDTQHLSNRYVAAYYDLLERRMLRKLKPYTAGLQQRNETTANLLNWNPTWLVQQQFTNLSGNGGNAYRHFQQQADTFQKHWQAYLLPFDLEDRSLRLNDFHRLPRFTYTSPPVQAPLLGMVSLYLLLLTAVLLAVGWLVERKRNI